MRGKVGLAIALAVAVHAFGCGGAEEPGLKVDIRLAQNLRGSLPVRVDVYLVDDCESVVVGIEPESAISSTFQLENLTTGPPLSNVSPGEYGLYVIARDVDCFVVGAGCEPVTVAEEDDAALAITVPELRGEGCADEELCVDGTGECVANGGAGGAGGAGATGGAGGDPVDDCSGQTDGTSCQTGGSSGRCRAGSCCTGCWDGGTCHPGDETVRCGNGGDSCELCECFTDVCESGACVPSTPFTDVDMGVDHTCAIADDGRAWCWGYDSHGQIGTGGAMPSTCDGNECTSPTEMNVQVEGSVPTWTDISAGEDATCGIRASDASLWCWGSNNQGRMGAPDTVDSSNVPMLISQAAHSKVDNQGRSGCAIRSADSSLWCWGDNFWGQLGQGPSGSGSDAFEPIEVPYGTPWDDFSVGDEFVLAIAGERYWGWGYNSDGQLGTGVTGGRTHPAVTGFVGSAVEAGSDTSCGLDLTGVAHCWGNNRDGQLGTGESSPTRVATPTPVSGGHRFEQIALGGASACAVTTNGALYCWGDNQRGQLGLGQEPSEATEPMRVGASSDWRRVTAGGDSACALREGGSLWCWGYNQRGQLGLGDTNTRDVPTRLCF